MGLADGDLFVSESILSYQQANRIYQNFRGASVPSALQPGALWSDSDDDKLYHKGASLFEVHTGATTMYKWLKGGDKTSAAALDISGLDGNYFDVTGANAITSITTSGRIGTVICLHFDAALTFTHHATNLILPSGANITTAAGDEAILIEYDTGKWRCINYSRADGTALVGSGGVTTTDGAWSKSIGSGGDYANWALMLAAMPDMISHAVTVTIEVGTTLTETCNLKNKHGLTKDAVITIQAEKYFPTSGAIPTADSATATTLRDAALATAALGNDYFNGCWISIEDGTGTDNGFVLITDYVDATGDVVVASWPGTQPDNTSRYLISGGLIDGGSARANAFVINNNTLPIYFYGIGVKDTTDIGVNVNFDTYFEARYCGIYNAGEEGLHLRNVSFGYLRHCGFVKNGNRGVEATSCDFVQITDNGISDNVVDGIGLRGGSFGVITNNFGDDNGAWGTNILQKSHVEFGGTECSGASGNHQYADGDFKDVEVTGTETKPGQPSFLAFLSSVQSNKTGDNTTYNVPFDTEVFDQGADYANPNFTAPVDGKYPLAGNVLLDDLDTGTFEGVAITLVTSNRTYLLAHHSGLSGSYHVGGLQAIPFSVTVDMDANDTAYIQVKVRGGAKTVDIWGDATNVGTCFSGHLAC